MDAHDLIPAPTTDAVDKYVQRWVAGTNGNLYVPLINKLQRYPIPRWPGSPSNPSGKLLLDIGCGWGRWLVASAGAGYIPVGVDLKLDAVQAARRVLRHFGLPGFGVVADLMALPFCSDSFDYVYSYSVLQHTHLRRARQCVVEIKRLMSQGGTLLCEFPSRHGLTNWRHMLKPRAETDDFESWCVRYYSQRFLAEWFREEFGNADLRADCFFGIGVRYEDIDMMPWKYRPLLVLSELAVRLSKVMPRLEWLSDSVFVECTKTGVPDNLARTLDKGCSDDNLSILPILRCPLSAGPLEYCAKSGKLISPEAKRQYPVVDGIPVLLEDAAEPLS